METPRVPSVLATMGNKPVYTHRPSYAFQSFQLAATPVRGHGYGYQALPGNTGHYATPHPTTTVANDVNLPGNTGQTDPQHTPRQQSAVYIGDAAAPTLPHGAPGEDGRVLFTYVLTEVMGCDQGLSTSILNLDRINTIHDVLALPPQCGSNGIFSLPLTTINLPVNTCVILRANSHHTERATPW
jgi:hypothetical protein